MKGRRYSEHNVLALRSRWLTKRCSWRRYTNMTNARHPCKNASSNNLKSWENPLTGTKVCYDFVSYFCVIQRAEQASRRIPHVSALCHQPLDHLHGSKLTTTEQWKGGMTTSGRLCTGRHCLSSWFDFHPPATLLHGWRGVIFDLLFTVEYFRAR